MKLGIFGGSFDPVHFGHLLLADVALESAGLDKVLWVPAATSPLKPHGPRATNRQRMEMLRLAIAGDDRFEVSEVELERDGISYTVDTLDTFRQQRPEDELFLLIGSDSLADFARWKDPDRICQLALPLIAARRGTSADPNLLAQWISPERLDEIISSTFSFPWIEISSTELRKRIAEGQSIRYRLPRAVECYIANANLYQEQT